MAYRYLWNNAPTRFYSHNLDLSLSKPNQDLSYTHGSWEWERTTWKLTTTSPAREHKHVQTPKKRSAIQYKHIVIRQKNPHIAQTLVCLHVPRHVYVCIWVMLSVKCLSPMIPLLLHPPSLLAAGSVKELGGPVRFSVIRTVYLARHSSTARRTGELAALPSLILAHVHPRQ